MPCTCTGICVLRYKYRGGYCCDTGPPLLQPGAIAHGLRLNRSSESEVRTSIAGWLYLLAELSASVVAHRSRRTSRRASNLAEAAADR